MLASLQRGRAALVSAFLFPLDCYTTKRYVTTPEPRNSPYRNRPNSLPPRALLFQTSTTEQASGRQNKAVSLTYIAPLI